MRWLARCLRSTGRHFRTTLLAGVVLFIPVAVTFVIFQFVFSALDPLLQPLFEQFISDYTPGMGIGALVVLIYLAGLVTLHVLGRRLLTIGHNIVDLIPMVSGVYRAARQATQVFSTVSADGKYTRVVLVEFPGYGLRSIGLVTGNIKDQDGNQLLAVYMPTSPFPTSGFLVLLPEDQVTPTDLPVDDAIKLIVSAGIVAPETILYNPEHVGRTIPRDTTQNQSPGSRASNQ